MKKLFLLLSLVSPTIYAIAQPTITGATNNPVAGDKFYMHFCDTTGVSKGASGAGATWNFASLTTSYIDSVSFIACAPTPFCDTFPGSTLASTYDSTDYDYYFTDANELSSSGYGSSSGSSYYSDRRSIIEYPMTYNTVKTDSFHSSQPAFMSASIGTDSFIADGYGTLILPTGTFNNVLRVRVISHVVDTFGFTTPPDILNYRSEAYYWYKPGNHFPMLVLYYDTAGSATQYLSDVWYVPFTPPSTGVKEAEMRANKVKVYPNPASDVANVVYYATKNERVAISITDMTGRMVSEVTEKDVRVGENKINIDIANLATGVYMLRLSTGAESVVRKIEVVK